MLDNEQTMFLVDLAQKGDENAKNVLIKENSPLVKSVIKRFKNNAIEYDDLFQIGCMGLLKAINNFDLTFNVRFSTYVVPMIIGEVKRFLRDDGIIKVSRTIKTKNRLINKFIAEYRENNGFTPTLDIISKQFNIEQQELVFIMDSSKMPISIYTPLESEDGSIMLIDRFAESEENDDNVDKIQLIEILNMLDEREKKLVMLRYFRDKTQSEIAHILNISQVQVSRLESKILNFMRDKLKVND